MPVSTIQGLAPTLSRECSVASKVWLAVFLKSCQPQTFVFFGLNKTKAIVICFEDPTSAYC